MDVFVTDDGEVLDLRDPAYLEDLAQHTPEALAAAISQLDTQIQDLQAIRATIQRPLIRQMDRDATMTAHVQGYTLKVNGSQDLREVWDPEVLARELSALADDGVISESAIQRAVRLKPEVMKSGITALRKLGNPQVSEILGMAMTLEPYQRRLTVKRGLPG